jgi:GDPmannose 4,6-dehydratase
MSPTALILGITSQDAPYMAQVLLKAGLKVVGGYRPRPDGESPDFSRLQRLGVKDDIELIPLDANDGDSLRQVLRQVQPSEIYNLVANTDVKLSYENPHYFTEVNGTNVLTMLEAVRHEAPEAKFCQPGSAQMFGQTLIAPQHEDTPCFPVSPYGIAKLFAHHTAKAYRLNYQLNTYTAILFNHESPLRSPAFVTQKIIHSVAAIAQGRSEAFTLGNVAAQRDWGYALDYMQGLYQLMRLPQGEDVLFATGQAQTVEGFVTAAAQAAQLNWVWEGEGLGRVAKDAKTGVVRVSVNPQFYRASDPDLLVGDASKARRLLNWSPSVSFDGLVGLMMDEALKAASSVAVC